MVCLSVIFLLDLVVKSALLIYSRLEFILRYIFEAAYFLLIKY
jgi:hypothetical protein